MENVEFKKSYQVIRIDFSTKARNVLFYAVKREFVDDGTLLFFDNGKSIVIPRKKTNSRFSSYWYSDNPEKIYKGDFIMQECFRVIKKDTGKIIHSQKGCADSISHHENYSVYRDVSGSLMTLFIMSGNYLLVIENVKHVEERENMLIYKVSYFLDDIYSAYLFTEHRFVDLREKVSGNVYDNSREKILHLISASGINSVSYLGIYTDYTHIFLEVEKDKYRIFEMKSGNEIKTTFVYSLKRKYGAEEMKIVDVFCSDEDDDDAYFKKIATIDNVCLLFNNAYFCKNGKQGEIYKFIKPRFLKAESRKVYSGKCLSVDKDKICFANGVWEKDFQGDLIFRPRKWWQFWKR